MSEPNPSADQTTGDSGSPDLSSASARVLPPDTYLEPRCANCTDPAYCRASGHLQEERDKRPLPSKSDEARRAGYETLPDGTLVAIREISPGELHALWECFYEKKEELHALWAERGKKS